MYINGLGSTPGGLYYKASSTYPGYLHISCHEDINHPHAEADSGRLLLVMSPDDQLQTRITQEEQTIIL